MDFTTTLAQNWSKQITEAKGPEELAQAIVNIEVCALQSKKDNEFDNQADMLTLRHMVEKNPFYDISTMGHPFKEALSVIGKMDNVKIFS